jgi:hypothetical protein
MYVFIGEPKFSSIGYKVGARFRLSYKYKCPMSDHHDHNPMIIIPTFVLCFHVSTKKRWVKPKLEIKNHNSRVKSKTNKNISQHLTNKRENILYEKKMYV